MLVTEPGAVGTVDVVFEIFNDRLLRTVATGRIAKVDADGST